jgi:hypothetical protein
LFWTKRKRAQTNQDYETWIERGVVPTLNAFDVGDGREVVIVAFDLMPISKDCMECGNDESCYIYPLCGDCLEANKLDDWIEIVGLRRLTPIEYERLQGFPDDWTFVCSDNQRYKQMGNAVTVNVIEWIGNRLDS